MLKYFHSYEEGQKWKKLRRFKCLKLKRNKVYEKTKYFEVSPF